MSANKNSSPGYFPSYFDYHGIDPGSYYGVHYRNTVRKLGFSSVPLSPFVPKAEDACTLSWLTPQIISMFPFDGGFCPTFFHFLGIGSLFCSWPEQFLSSIKNSNFAGLDRQTGSVPILERADFLKSRPAKTTQHGISWLVLSNKINPPDPPFGH